MSNYVALRSFRRKGFMILLLFLTISSSLYISVNIAAENLDRFAKNSWVNYVGDLRLTGSFNELFLSELLKENYVIDAVGLSLIYTKAFSNNKNFSAMIVIPSSSKGLMGYELIKGNEEGLLYVTSSTAKLDIGENLKLYLPSPKSLNITGYASAFYNFGLVDLQLILNKETALKIFRSINYSMVFLKLKNVEEIEKKLAIIAIQTGSKIESIIALDPEAYPGKEEINAVKSVFNLFSYITLLIVFIALAFYQLIHLETNRREIYYLRAIGLKNKEILLVYIMPIFLVFLAGSLISFFISFPLSSYIFDSALRSTPLTFSEVLLNRFVFSFNVMTAIFSLLIIILFFSISSLLVYLAFLRSNGVSKSRFFGNLSMKLIFGLTLQKIWHAALVIFLFALMISSLASVNSFISNWDSSVKDLNSFYDFFIYAIGNGDTLYNLNATVIQANFHFAKVENRSVVTASFLSFGPAMPKLIEGKWPSKNEAVISLTLAKSLKLKLGDEVRYSIGIKDYYFKVVGIASIPLFYLYTRDTESVILNFEDYKSIFGKGEDFAIFLKGDPSPIVKKLESNGFNVYLRSRNESIRIGVEGGRIALVFLEFISLSLALISVVFTSMIIALGLFSRIKDIAIMKLLGIRTRNLIRITITSLFFLFLTSLPFSFFLSLLFNRLVYPQLSVFTGFFEFNVSIEAIFQASIMIMIPISLITFLSFLVMRRLNLPKLLSG